MSDRFLNTPLIVVSNKQIKYVMCLNHVFVNIQIKKYRFQLVLAKKATK